MDTQICLGCLSDCWSLMRGLALAFFKDNLYWVVGPVAFVLFGYYACKYGLNGGAAGRADWSWESPQMRSQRLLETRANFFGAVPVVALGFAIVLSAVYAARTGQDGPDGLRQLMLGYAFPEIGLILLILASATARKRYGFLYRLVGKGKLEPGLPLGLWKAGKRDKESLWAWLWGDGCCVGLCLATALLLSVTECSYLAVGAGRGSYEVMTGRVVAVKLPVTVQDAYAVLPTGEK